MKFTRQEIQDAFHSSTNSFRIDLEMINKIYFLLENSYISCTKESLSTKSEYHNICDMHFSDTSQADSISNGDSDGHNALKVIAGNYLKNIGKVAKYEENYLGYFPDVISADNTVIIECGHTNNSDKMLEYFTQGNIEAFIQLPYPSDEDESIFGYIFTARENLSEFLSAERDVAKQDILNILNKR